MHIKNNLCNIMEFIGDDSALFSFQSPLIKKKSVDERRVLSIMANMGKLCPKGVASSGSRYMKW